MQNYQLMDVDASRSQASLNIPDEDGRKFQVDRPGIFGITTRMLLTIIAIIFFVLSLILFIGTIVAYYNAPTLIAEVPEKAQIIKDGKQVGDDGKGIVQPSDKWSITTVNDQRVRPNTLVFTEDFTSFNTTNWKHYTDDSDNNFYFHVEDDQNSFVKNGILHLKPTYTVDSLGEAYMANGSLLFGKLPSQICKNELVTSQCWNTQAYKHPIQAPMIMSKSFFKYKYGKLVIRAKMPSADWIEPIISLQPADFVYGNDLLSGQIHFVDTRGNRKLTNLDGVNIGSEQMCPDIRYGKNDKRSILYYCVNTEENQGFDREFHDYELEWTPQTVTLKIDGIGIVAAPFPRPTMYDMWAKGRQIPNPWSDKDKSNNHVVAPFDQNVKLINIFNVMYLYQFYLVLGLSVGGTSGFFSDDAVNAAYPKPWNNTDSNAPKAFWDARNLWEPTWDNGGSDLLIDYIHLYSLPETVSD